MLPLPAKCPVCGGEIVVTRIHCRDCDSTIESRFAIAAPFGMLNQTQLEFIELFVRCEGKLSRMEDELQLSYPTIRNRLHEIIRAMGYEPGKDEPTSPAPQIGLTGSARLKILSQLETGEISYEEAMRQLQESEA